MSAMDIHEIMQYLPHRFPFLMLDRVELVEPGTRIVAIKNVTINEPFFPGHFPTRPVMPGVLILEAMAQAAAILSFKSADKKPDVNSVYYLSYRQSALQKAGRARGSVTARGAF